MFQTAFRRLKRRVKRRNAVFWRFRMRLKHRNNNGFRVLDIYKVYARGPVRRKAAHGAGHGRQEGPEPSVRRRGADLTEGLPLRKCKTNCFELIYKCTMKTFN